MRRPWWTGGASILEQSASCSSTWSTTLRPSSTWAISRPRKTTVTITLFLWARNSRAWLTLVSRSLIARLRADADFFDPHLMGLALVLPLLLLVLELAEVHDPADGRALVGRHFDQVQPGLAGLGQGIRRGHDAQLRRSSLITRMGVTRICSLIFCFGSTVVFRIQLPVQLWKRLGPIEYRNPRGKSTGFWKKPVFGTLRVTPPVGVAVALPTRPVSTLPPQRSPA